jgi:hypothetical protein
MQTGVPLAGALVHWLLHAPQLLGSVLRLTSQPSEATPLQSAKPALQVKPQVPLVQVRVALARLGQLLLHAPQLLRSVLRLTQAPPQLT